MKFRIFFLFGLILSLNLFAQPQVLTEAQLGNQRVWNARLSSDAELKKVFEKVNLSYPPKFVYWRVFKHEREIELWAADSFHHTYKLVKIYHFVKLSGSLGPKRQEGDFQVPEGFYTINQYNPYSNFYLSFKVSYPNKSDSILGSKGNYGGQIFVHGDSVTIGCLPMSNEVIKEMYWCNIQAQNNKDTNYHIPIHIFPCRMTHVKWDMLKKYYPSQHQEFWKNLQQGYAYFELFKQPPKVAVDKQGKYYLVFK